MFMDEHLGRPTAAANRPTHARARPDRRLEPRDFPARSEAEANPADHPRATVVPRISGGRDFNPAGNTRATARFLSRCLTRAKFSPFVRPNSVARGGTVNRPRTHVTHRKQTTEHMQGRNFPVHFLFLIFGQNTIALALRSLGGRSFSSVIKNHGEATHLSRWVTRATHLSSTTHQSLVTNHRHLPGVPETLRVLGWLAGAPETPRVLGWLPETVIRVETHLSHRKQTTAHASTRNVPAHGYFQVLFARAPAFARRARRQIAGEREGKNGRRAAGATRKRTPSMAFETFSRPRISRRNSRIDHERLGPEGLRRNRRKHWGWEFDSFSKSICARAGRAT